MPALFTMPFLARLTSDHHHSHPSGSALERSREDDGSKKRPHEPRPFEETRERRKEAKRPRLGTQVLSSRPKLFANGLLSPVKSVETSPTVPDRTPGRVPVPAKKAGITPPEDTTSAKGRGGGDSRNGGVNSNSGRRTKAKSSSTVRNAQQKNSNPITSYFKSRDKIESASLAQPPAQQLTEQQPVRQEKEQQQQAQEQPHEQQPASSSKPEDKRSLRSHDGGTRARSELAQYFPNWDEIVSDDPLPQDPITYRTRLRITDEPLKPPSTPSRARQVILPAPPTPCTPSTPIAPFASPSRSRRRASVATGVSSTASASTVNAVGPPAEQTFARVSFASEVTKLPRNAANDPLSEEHFRPAHQRGERQEKQLRNIEKEKAQHEKVQLERLYEGLLGRDWLRQMGISGVTDGEKREKWEAKRDYVMAEVKAMLDKFDRYRDEEKRLRLEKEASMREDEEESDEEEGSEDEEDEEAAEQEDEDARSEANDDGRDSDAEASQHRKRRHQPGAQVTKGMKRARRRSTAEDQAAAAAQQLITETLSNQMDPVNLPPSSPKASAGGGIGKHRRFASLSSRTGIDVTPQVQYAAPGTERPFVSFFEKPHLRAAAIAGHRRGRARFAFGHAVPEWEEREFSLPEDWLTVEARRDAARLRRMRRRSRMMEEN